MTALVLLIMWQHVLGLNCVSNVVLHPLNDLSQQNSRSRHSLLNVEATVVFSLMLLIQLEHSDIRCHRLEEATDQSFMFEVDHKS